MWEASVREDPSRLLKLQSALRGLNIAIDLFTNPSTRYGIGPKAEAGALPFPFSACVLHVCYMCVAFVLHMCYICVAFVLPELPSPSSMCYCVDVTGALLGACKGQAALWYEGKDRPTRVRRRTPVSACVV